MNKRIKKKKAKQAIQREQEKLSQEMGQITPEQIEEIWKGVTLAFREIGKSIACIIDGLVEFFKNLEVTIEETERQRTQTTGRRTIRFSDHPAHHRFTKAGINNKKSRQSARSFYRRKQTNRNYGHQNRR